MRRRLNLVSHITHAFEFSPMLREIVNERSYSVPGLLYSAGFDIALSNGRDQKGACK